MKNVRTPTRAKFIQFSEEGTEDLAHWRSVFVAMCDPTEYGPAIELAGSWEEWCRMKKEWKEFREVILIDWLAEVEVKLRSDAVRNLCEQARTPNGAAAAKWVAEGKYKPSKAGRPSNAEVERQAKIQAKVDDEVTDEIARVQEAMSSNNNMIRID